MVYRCDRCRLEKLCQLVYRQRAAKSQLFRQAKKTVKTIHHRQVEKNLMTTNLPIGRSCYVWIFISKLQRVDDSQNFTNNRNIRINSEIGLDFRTWAMNTYRLFRPVTSGYIIKSRKRCLGSIMYRARTVRATSMSFLCSSSIISSFTANSRVGSAMIGYGKLLTSPRQADLISFWHENTIEKSRQFD